MQIISTYGNIGSGKSTFLKKEFAKAKGAIDAIYIPELLETRSETKLLQKSYNSLKHSFKFQKQLLKRKTDDLIAAKKKGYMYAYLDSSFIQDMLWGEFKFKGTKYWENWKIFLEEQTVRRMRNQVYGETVYFINTGIKVIQNRIKERNRTDLVWEEKFAAQALHNKYFDGGIKEINKLLFRNFKPNKFKVKVMTDETKKLELVMQEIAEVL